MIRETESEPSREELIALIAALRAENASLKARIAELERRLGLNSSNSGKPPSSDGLKKPVRVKSLREGSGKQRGGQKGHKGETLRQVTDPDDVVDHYPSACSMCGAGLGPEASVGHSARQVFDLPKPQPLIVTEHRAHDCQCAACGAKTRAPFPDGVNAPVQYGVGIAAFVVYLLHYQLLPEDRLAELMADLFGVKLAAATIARMSRTCAERLRGFAETVRDLVAGAPVKHMDETGFRIGGKTQWLHVASTALLTFYRVCAKRGSLLANVAGIVVHDHWKPYYTMQGVLHALCNAHHLRELKALVEIEKEDVGKQDAAAVAPRVSRREQTSEATIATVSTLVTARNLACQVCSRPAREGLPVAGLYSLEPIAKQADRALWRNHPLWNEARYASPALLQCLPVQSRGPSPRSRRSHMCRFLHCLFPP